MTQREERVCRLCKRVRPLAESHIIPEFMYKPLYDEKHRLITLSTDKHHPSLKLQSGLKEKLLCYGNDGCEMKLNKWETYASQIIPHRLNQPEKYINPWIIKEIDYELFKLFQLSIIWRASISSHRFFTNVTLGSHEERIRLMLHEGNPGEPHKYGCIIMMPKDINTWASQMILMPEMTRIDNHIVCWFILNGFLWMYFVSNHTDKIPEQNYFLSRKNILPIILGPDDFLQNILNSFVKKKMQFMNKTEPSKLELEKS